MIALIWLLVGQKRGNGRPEALPSVKNERKETVTVPSEPKREPMIPIPAPRPRKHEPALPARHHHPVDTSKFRAAPVVPGGEHPTGIDTAGAGTRALSAVAAKTGKSLACAQDTEPPWVYPDPSGGLHRHPVNVVLSATKPCAIEWKSDSAAPFSAYKGDTIRISSSTTLYFRAHDSCGNVMDERRESYEISLGDTTRYCPKDMEYVKVGSTRFCIDHYEWPNVKGVMPLSFISLYNAADSCVAAGKRLCTTDEWTVACTGPYGWRYAYGNEYEPRACVSHDTTARPSGSKPECRGYFEVFDMAGNLAEWTDTRSDKNPEFYNVKGGFWDSGLHTGCFDERYSYYPQNRHNPVGFRCCKDAAPQ